MRIVGTVSDNRRVGHVTVTAVGERDLVLFGSVFVQFAEADLSCNSRRRACTWQVDLPPESAQYKVTAVAYDRAGNRGRSAKTGVVVITPPTNLP